MQPHANVDWSALGQSIYSYWTLGLGVVTFVGVVFRSKIGRRWRRFIDSLRSARAQSLKIDALSSQLIDAEAKADDWQARFTEMEARYDALDAEFKRLREDMNEFRKRMTTAEEINKMLKHDRDALIDYSRLLIGQATQSGLKLDYPMPSLQSIIAVPGPPLIVPGAPLAPKG